MDLVSSSHYDTNTFLFFFFFFKQPNFFKISYQTIAYWVGEMF